VRGSEDEGREGQGRETKPPVRPCALVSYRAGDDLCGLRLHRSTCRMHSAPPAAFSRRPQLLPSPLKLCWACGQAPRPEDAVSRAASEPESR